MKMRKLLYTLLFSLLCVSTIKAESYWVGDTEFSINLGAGFREDSLTWNIAGPNHKPKVLSKLSWRDLQIWQGIGEFKMISGNHIYVRFRGDYGKIHRGKNRDSDFKWNKHPIEYSRSDNDAGKGEVWDLSAGIGYQFLYCCDQLKISPLVGYNRSEQHLRMFNGFQTIDLIHGDTGPIKRLHSNYRGKWYGPWAGIDLEYLLDCQVKLFATFEFHIDHYHGTGHWNLRHDFLHDFRHLGYALGTYSMIGINYEACQGLEIGLLANYQERDLRNGVDIVRIQHYIQHWLKLSTNKVKSHLNEVCWNSWSINGYLSYTF